MIVLDPPELCGDFFGMIEGLDDLGIWLPLGSEAGLTDLSGNGYNGTAQGGVTVGAGAGLIPNDTDTSTDFDGSNDYISTTYTTRRNLIPNPSFEVDITGWRTNGAAVPTRVSSWASVGAYSMRLNVTGAAAGAFFTGNSTTGSLTPVATATATYAVKLKLNATTGRIRVGLVFRTAAGASTGSTPLVSSSGTGVQEIVIPGMLAPALTTNVTLDIYLDEGLTACDVSVDAILIEAASSAGAYFDGTGYVNDAGTWVDDTSGNVTGWLGTAHASASDKGAFANGTVRTFMGVAKRDTSSGYDALFGASQALSVPRLYLNTGNNTVYWHANTASSTEDSWASAWPGNGIATFWALVFDEANNQAELFVQGVSMGVVNHDSQYDDNATFAIGVDQLGGNFFDGPMQHVAVVEGALSAGQIVELAGAARQGPTRKSLTLGGTAGSAIRVAKNGIDWGDAGIVAYLADRQLGAQPLGYRVPNRIITIKLLLMAFGGTTFEAARRQLQAKVGRIQKEQKGWLKRERDSGDLYCDLIGATLNLPDSELAERGFEPEATLILEAIPDFYGDEEEGALYTAATNGEVSFTITDPSGDLPSRVRVELEELGNDEIRSLFWAVRSKQIGEATALMAYEAEALTPMGGAIATQSGATGGASNNVVSKTALSTTFRPILSTEIDGVGPMTHIGLHRVLARVYNPNLAGIDLALRLESFSGDPTRPEYGPIVSDLPPVDWQIVPLGTINPPRAKVGDQGWEGRLLAKSSDLGGVKIDRVWILPVEEGEGQIVASSTLPSPESDTLWDNFDQTAGNLTGKALPSTGAPVWTAVASSDAADFTIDTAAHTATRNVVSDVAWTGRYLSAGTAAHAGVRVAADLDLSNAAGITDGIFLRLVDINNWLMLRADVGTERFELLKRVGGGTPLSLFADDLGSFAVLGVLYPFRLTAEAHTDGTWKLALTNPGVEPTAFEHVGSDSVLATGGTLDDGTVGIYDEYTGATAGLTRVFDNFSVAALPAGDAVLYPLAAAELRSDGYVRESPSGIYSEIPPYSGDLPRQPATGLEERDAEWLISISRGNLAEKPDTDRPGGSFSARVAHRPSWLVVPGD